MSNPMDESFEEPQHPHVPMTLEQQGDTWTYCYGQSTVIFPVYTGEVVDEYHQ